MSLLLKLSIKLYWFFIPEHRRRNCLYRVSCSKHVYHTTNQSGFIKGFSELKKRFKNCRPGYEIIYLDDENTLIVNLKDGSTLQHSDISLNIINQNINIK